MSEPTRAPKSNEEETAKAPDAENDFFVGYLAMPARVFRFQRLVIPAVIVLMLASAAILAHTMTPVRARFESEPVMMTGLFQAYPAPILWVHDMGQATRARGILVVQSGKFGLSESVAEEFDNRVVRVAGVLIERDGLGMLELSRPPVEGTLEDPILAPLVDITEVPRGHVHLRGELVDSKCWIGRMRPGLGRTHRACAQQCVAGGIPPMLVTRAANGVEIGYVLADLSDSTLNAILPLLADSVEVEGELFTIGSLWMLRLDPASLRRL